MSDNQSLRQRLRPPHQFRFHIDFTAVALMSCTDISLVCSRLSLLGGGDVCKSVGGKLPVVEDWGGKGGYVRKNSGWYTRQGSHDGLTQQQQATTVEVYLTKTSRAEHFAMKFTTLDAASFSR
jgi:hypothetical protein